MVKETFGKKQFNSSNISRALDNTFSQVVIATNRHSPSLMWKLLFFVYMFFLSQRASLGLVSVNSYVKEKYIYICVSMNFGTTVTLRLYILQLAEHPSVLGKDILVGFIHQYEFEFRPVYGNFVQFGTHITLQNQ